MASEVEVRGFLLSDKEKWKFDASVSPASIQCLSGKHKVKRVFCRISPQYLILDKVSFTWDGNRLSPTDGSAHYGGFGEVSGSSARWVFPGETKDGSFYSFDTAGERVSRSFLTRCLLSAQ